MPHGPVKTKADEKIWQTAIKIVEKQYPDKPKKNGGEFWKIVMGVYQNIKKGKDKKKKKTAADELRKVAAEILNISR